MALTSCGMTKKHVRRQVRQVSPRAASSVTTQAYNGSSNQLRNLMRPPQTSLFAWRGGEGRTSNCGFRHTSQNGSAGMAQNKAQPANTAAQVNVHPAQGPRGGSRRPTLLSLRSCFWGARTAAEVRDRRVRKERICILGLRLGGGMDRLTDEVDYVRE